MVKFGKLKNLIFSFALLPLAACKEAAYVPSVWLTRVPYAARLQTSPLPTTPAHVQQGQDQYGLYCSSCHAADGAGRRSKPSLRNARVRAETDGQIHWILVNGSKGHGMPAWRSLGDTSLWELVQYIRSLPTEK